jgi:hypothetical protein
LTMKYPSRAAAIPRFICFMFHPTFWFLDFLYRGIVERFRRHQHHLPNDLTEYKWRRRRRSSYFILPSLWWADGFILTACVWLGRRRDPTNPMTEISFVWVSLYLCLSITLSLFGSHIECDSPFTCWGQWGQLDDYFGILEGIIGDIDFIFDKSVEWFSHPLTRVIKRYLFQK